MEDSSWNPITLVTEVGSEDLCSGADAERRGILTVLTGSQVGSLFTLAEGDILGRARHCAIMLDDEGVSREHARIVRNGSDFEIVDLASRNGTYVDGERVVLRQHLREGARIRIANVSLKFSLQDTIEAEAARRMYELSVRDGLTGVHNRRYFDERLAGELSYAQRRGTPLCVLILDIDHFKRVNDTLGHRAGDFVLQRVAGALRDTVRAEDVLARFGGEEFVVLARGIDVAGARTLAERLRTCVERLDVIVDGRRVPVTISIGLAHNQVGGHRLTEAALLAAADGALYSAKRSGRNRVGHAVSPGRYSGVEADSEPTARRRFRDQITAPSLEGELPSEGREPWRA